MSKTVCPTHERAYEVLEGCLYCPPSAVAGARPLVLPLPSGRDYATMKVGDLVCIVSPFQLIGSGYFRIVSFENGYATCEDAGVDPVRERWLLNGPTVWAAYEAWAKSITGAGLTASRVLAVLQVTADKGMCSVIIHMALRDGVIAPHTAKYWTKHYATP